MKVWDLPTRLYHWLQLALFVALIASGITEQGPHVTLGLALLTLLLWRVIWGFIGSETSRFSQFVKSPQAVLRYLQGNYPERPGHNPAGALMVMALIALLLLQCLTGLALAGMLDPLPGSEAWLNDDNFDICVLIHENLFKGLIALSVIHVVAIIIYKLKSKPLLMAMITGRQHTAKGLPVYLAPLAYAVIALVIATSITGYLYYLSME
jgi:cytochrome b